MAYASSNSGYRLRRSRTGPFLLRVSALALITGVVAVVGAAVATGGLDDLLGATSEGGDTLAVTTTHPATATASRARSTEVSETKDIGDVPRWAFDPAPIMPSAAPRSFALNAPAPPAFVIAAATPTVVAPPSALKMALAEVIEVAPLPPSRPRDIAVKIEATAPLSREPAVMIVEPPARPRDVARNVDTPPPTPLVSEPSIHQRDMARGPVVAPIRPGGRTTVAKREAPAPVAAKADGGGFFEKLFGARQTPGPALAYARPDEGFTSVPRYNPSGAPATFDRYTAIYDIRAHAVILPSGERLEAHSGLGARLDDPSHVHEKNRGATPPNVYDLTLRESLFHGVQALRLTPIGSNPMYGRDGILAHTYMLGPRGDSNGCVSFRDYNRFLSAYRNGEIKRLVVVANR